MESNLLLETYLKRLRLPTISRSYPQAIARALGCAGGHKSKKEGHGEQLEAVAAATGWQREELRSALAAQGYGSRHDKLDAFMAAWVASLPKGRLLACGKPPDDAIWVPRMGGNE